MSRSHETIIDIKATPEEVFRALTDPEQIVKWFAPGARVEPRVGGEYVKVWGPEMESTSTISAWEPGKHFGTYSERSIAYGPKAGGHRRCPKDVCRLLHRIAGRRNHAPSCGSVRLRPRSSVGRRVRRNENRVGGLLEKTKGVARKIIHHATKTLEHNCARLAVAHLGLLKRRTGREISAT